MRFSLAPLLLHDDIPPKARDALRVGLSQSPEEGVPFLAAAARILHRELGIDCADAMELVSLSPMPCT